MHSRYRDDLPWFKGNTHIHTTLSDGGLPPEEVIGLYRQAGYDFICITDHWHAYREGRLIIDSSQSYARERFKGKELPRESISSRYRNYSHETRRLPILVLNGIEIDGKDSHGHYYHAAAIGTFDQMEPSSDLDQSISTLLSQDAFLILAHPYWSGNGCEDALTYPFHAIEVYNHVCDSLSGKGDAKPFWEAALQQNPNLLGIAADDAHFIPAHPGWNGGWIMLQAEKLSQAAVMEALRAGRFYATRGPEFHRISASEQELVCRTSPIERAWLVGAGYAGARLAITAGNADAAGREAEAGFTADTEFTADAQRTAHAEQTCTIRFALDQLAPENPLHRSPYLRLEIEDAQGKRAWSNTLFL